MSEMNTAPRYYGPKVPAGVDTRAVREWGKANGLVPADSNRGRISQTVIDAYLRAHQE